MLTIAAASVITTRKGALRVMPTRDEIFTSRLLLRFYFLLAYYKRKRRENARKNLFDFWKNRKYNNHKRVASKRKSSLPATRFFVKIIYLP